MTSREAFEAHLGKRKGFRRPTFRQKSTGDYYFDIVQIAWESWQASERSAIERAIAEAEKSKMYADYGTLDLAQISPGARGMANIDRDAIDRVIANLKELLNDQ